MRLTENERSSAPGGARLESTRVAAMACRQRRWRRARRRRKRHAVQTRTQTRTRTRERSLRVETRGARVRAARAAHRALARARPSSPAAI